ncbi:chondrolectin-like isoform X1 [Myxocyprinus asiaticus]|uniref:chondrolectin-like isoform X1 n=1 Tax=Myxocyprinus asiaticus TaxID=70543 RepID=UPI0022232AE5|nr:chondrolectin-like isoform X1 [Myxocyprinus asiaticus]
MHFSPSSPHSNAPVKHARMRADLQILCALTVLVSCCHGARVVSGQTVCQGSPEHPCYKIAYFRDVSSRVAFWEALQACEMDGGSLLSIENSSEQRHIEHLLKELSVSSSTGTASGPSITDGDFWIGLTRAENENTQESGSFASCPNLYRWTDGSVSQFRNWYADEPSCGGEACVVMYHQPTAVDGPGGPYLYQWNDDRCNMKHNFICKYEPESYLVKEQGDRPVGRDADFSTEEQEERTPPINEDESPQLIIPGPSSMLLIYVIIPTIPLLLLILVASGTCCFQMLSKSKPRTKTSINQSTLWISKTPKLDSSMEV